MDTPEPVVILLVEDNPADAELLSEGIAEAGLDVALSTAGTGQEALDFLRLRSPAPERLPGLILLDLNLPGLDGLGVLREIKNAGDLKRTPVLMLSSSSSERDVLACYELGASAYLVKPSNLKELRELMAALRDFWLTACTLPPVRLH